MAAVATRTTTRPAELMPRRLKDAGHELMSALEELARVAGGWESALDELVGCDAPPHAGVDPEALVAARARLNTAGEAWDTAGEAWAAMVTEPQRPDPRRLDPRRLDAALDRIGHQGSPAFRRRLATAYQQVA